MLVGKGILILGSADDVEVKDAAGRLRLPIVAIDDAADNVLMPTVGTDSRAGVRLAVEHLLATGRRRIAYLRSDFDLFYTREREAGYVNALRDAGLLNDPRLIVTCKDTGSSATTTYPELDRFLASGASFDALVLEGDNLAVPALRALRRAGLSVPDDVAVVGFDDDRLARIIDPPLTTVRQPYELGRVAAWSTHSVG